MWDSNKTVKSTLLLVNSPHSANQQNILNYELKEIQVNDQTFAINTYTTAILTKQLLSAIPADNNLVIVYYLNWLETPQWNDQITSLFRDTAGKQMEIVLTTCNYEKAASQFLRTASLNQDIDFCHQYLRKIRLENHCWLYYSLNHEKELNYHTLMTQIIQQQDIEPQLYGDTVLINEKSKDSYEKILTVNDKFDINSDSALPALINTPEVDEPPAFDFTTTYKNLVGEFADKGKVQSQFNLPAKNSEDKQLLTDFFTQLAEKSGM